MFVLEAAVMISIILGLFRARTLLGYTPLYIVLGGFQFLEANLNLRAEIANDFVLNPASVVLFTATLATVILIYVKDDAFEARKLLYGLALANAAVSLVALLIGWHLTLDGSESTVNAHTMLVSARVSMAGTTLLFLDVLGIILIYEYVSRFVSSLLPRLVVSLVTIMLFDQTFFTRIVQSDHPRLLHTIYTGMVGKSLVATFYGFVCWSYLRYGEPHTATVGTGDVADVFQMLTYRQKYEQVRQRMVRDGLTGLYNRGYFDEVLPQALGHARRHRESLSLLIVDTDNFQRINDQLSHLDGDAALRLIADVMQSQVRPSDTPCRYGGDEFVVLLSGADGAAAAGFADRFRASLFERCRTASPPFPWGYITTTIGIASYPADGDPPTPADFIRIADKRLYFGKQAGRDIVITGGQGADSYQTAHTA